MERPKVGVAVIVRHINQVLLGYRINSHGSGTWSFPGGHLEFGESIEDCASRELLEETGLIAKDLKTVSVTNDIFESEGKHYVTIFVQAEFNGGTPELREPEKYKEWKWCAWGDLPSPLFLPISNLIRQGFSI